MTATMTQALGERWTQYLQAHGLHLEPARVTPWFFGEHRGLGYHGIARDRADGTVTFYPASTHLAGLNLVCRKDEVRFIYPCDVHGTKVD